MLLKVYKVNEPMAMVQHMFRAVRAAYMLWPVKRTIMGNVINPKINSVVEINQAQIFVFPYYWQF